MCGGRRGFSLIEILIACVLLILILGLILEVVVPMGRGTVRGSQQIELQQIGSTVLNRICEDLETAATAGITRYPATGIPAGNQTLLLSIQPLTGVDSAGQQTWSESLILYWWKPQNGKLYRMTWPPGYPLARRPDFDQPFKPTQLELTRLVDNPEREKFMGVIKTLDLDLSVVPHVLKMSLEANPVGGAPPETFSVERRIYLRNERY